MSPNAPPSSTTANSVTEANTQPASSNITPEKLLTLDLSAYHASLGIDNDAVYLLTPKAAYRLVSGKKPQEMALDLGHGAVFTPSSFLYWSKNALYRAPKRGGAPVRLGEVPHRPHMLAASGEYFAWLDRSDEGRFKVQTLVNKKLSTVYETTASLEALTLLDNWAFFVERAVDSTWRIASIRIVDGTPTFTAPKTGRTPAMLRAAGDVFYYDGNSRNVYALSPDLKHEEVIAKDFICSPIAAADRIFCAQFNGLFELSRVPAEPQMLAKFHREPIAQIVANRSKVAWVSDIGADKLAVLTLPISDPSLKRK